MGWRFLGQMLAPNVCLHGGSLSALMELLTGRLFCWVKSWAAGCPLSPHHHTPLWPGRAACSAPWTAQPSSDSCQRWGRDSFCCSGWTPTVRRLRTANSALSWWPGLSNGECSFQVMSSQFVWQVETISHRLALPVRSGASCSPSPAPCWSPAAWL